MDTPYWKLCEEKAPAAAQAIFDSWDGSLTFVGHLNWVYQDYRPKPDPTTNKYDDIWHRKVVEAALNMLAEAVKGGQYGR